MAVVKKDGRSTMSIECGLLFASNSSPLRVYDCTYAFLNLECCRLAELEPQRDNLRSLGTCTCTCAGTSTIVLVDRKKSCESYFRRNP